MVCTVNKGTKCGQFLEEQEKTYVATLKLGIATDSLDKDGNIIEEKEVPYIDQYIIWDVFKSFIGEIEQTVPLYSAIKKDGKRLCDYAREGNTDITLPSRKIIISDLALLGYDDTSICFRVTCSKGTYIRSLGHDIASKLGTVGHLTKLKRTRVGNFKIEDSKKLEEVCSDDLISIYDALSSSLPTLEVDDKTALDLKNGKHLVFKDLKDKVFICDKKHNPICIIERDHNDVYKVTRGLF